MKLAVLFLVVILSGCSTGIYGNFCGAGYPADDSIFDNPDAIETAVDWLDEACFRHDKCYRDKGYADCNCDKQILTEIGQQSMYFGGLEWDSVPPSLGERQRQNAMLKGRVFVAYFESTVCLPRDLEGLVYGNKAAKWYLSQYFDWMENPTSYNRSLQDALNQQRWQREKIEEKRCSAADRFYGYCDNREWW
tara:strand:- start:2395 stop:2970 length:576 start_codon:yes stop_codon:yes gene_type:complete